MTIGMLIESMAGKAAAVHGAFQVGSRLPVVTKMPKSNDGFEMLVHLIVREYLQATSLATRPLIAQDATAFREFRKQKETGNRWIDQEGHHGK